MRIILKTAVEQSHDQVFDQFDQSLFKALAPPFPPIKIERFDGKAIGDVVIVKLGLINQRWVSKITSVIQSEKESSFTDQGQELPFFLSKWVHHHRILAHEKGALIVDDITYQSPYKVLDYLLYPIMWAQFAYRKPIYRKWFGRKAN